MSGFQYVSSVEGHLVTRFPSLRASTAQYIGATRKDKTITWDTNTVVAISDDEGKKYRKEYRRAVSDGALKVRTEVEYKAFIEGRDKDDAELTNKLAADRKKAERKARKEASSTDSSEPSKGIETTTELSSSEDASESQASEGESK